MTHIYSSLILTGFPIFLTKKDNIFPYKRQLSPLIDESIGKSRHLADTINLFRDRSLHFVVILIKRFVLS